MRANEMQRGLRGDGDRPGASGRVAVGLMLLAVIGCASPEELESTPVRGGGLHGTLSGDSTHLGEAGVSALDAERFALVFQQCLGESRPRRLRELVGRYPDAALEALLDGSLDPKGAAARALARAFDALLPMGSGGFLQRRSDEQRRPEDYAAFREARRSCYRFLREGRIARALEVDLPRLAEGLTAIDRGEAARVRAITLLMAQRPAAAARLLARGAAERRPASPSRSSGDRRELEVSSGTPALVARTSTATQPELAAWLRVRQAVLHCDAVRRIGHLDEWARSWGEAVTLLSQTLEDSPGLQDPARWERMLHLRPGAAVWPRSVGTVLWRSITTQPGAGWQNDVVESAPVEALARAQVGLWRIARGEAAAALLSLEKAEVAFTSEELRREARLHQARALLELGQRAAAQSLLTDLAVHGGPVGDTSLAALGQLVARDGQIERGRAFLEKAMGRAGEQRWPGRSRAEADLALVLLIQGFEDEGLERLHRAQRAFADDPDQLRKSLENERRYWAATGNPDRAADLEARIATLY